MMDFVKHLACRTVVVSTIFLAPAALEASVITFTGPGGAVQDDTSAGASFDIVVNDPRLILSSGNNVTFSLINVKDGALVELIATLEHVGFGAPQYAFDQVLDVQTFICAADLNGTYTFDSGASATFRNSCGPGRIGNQPSVMPPGTYMTTMPDDTTNSNLSSFWNGQTAAGIWRLHIADTNINHSDPGVYALNSDWTWQLNVNVEDAATVPEPTSLLLLGTGLLGAVVNRRRRTR